MRWNITDTRALYLFPIKALAQDQMAELYQTIEGLGEDIATFTYDGDTPQDARKAIRSKAHIVVTNPDMLHKGTPRGDRYFAIYNPPPEPDPETDPDPVPGRRSSFAQTAKITRVHSCRQLPTLRSWPSTFLRRRGRFSPRTCWSRCLRFCKTRMVGRRRG